MGTWVNMPREVRVAVDASGEPRSIARDGGGWEVSRVQNRWRVDDGWWSGETSRMYYQLLLRDGAVITVFRDLLTGKWYRQHY